MARLESDKVEQALRYKMKAECEDSGDWYYYIKDEKGNEIASRSCLKGLKRPWVMDE